MSNMRLSRNGAKFLQDREMCWLRAYRDSGGVWTIGWGHTQGVAEGDECTREQALRWFAADTKWAVDAVNTHVRVPLTQNQFDALVSFVFNVGGSAFADSTLLAKLNAGRAEAASAQFGRWIYDNGEVVQGLINRRNLECKLFLTPTSQTS